MIDFHLRSERQEWGIMELLSFGLYLFSLVFLLFPFLFSCLSCDSFCWLPFRLRFFLLIPFVFSSLVFPPAAFTFCQVSAFGLQVFSSGGFVFPSGLRSGTKPKRRQKRRQNSRQAAWHELGQEQANLLPHPATTATTTIAIAGPSCAFAEGICLTSTSKAPRAPASPRLLLLLMQLQLLLMLMLLVLVLVAGSCDLLWLAVTAVIAVAAVTAVTCCCHCCHCSCHCYSSATAPAPAPAACAATVASSSTFVASTSHSTNPSTSWHCFLQLLPLLLPLARNDDCAISHVYLWRFGRNPCKTKVTL